LPDFNDFFSGTHRSLIFLITVGSRFLKSIRIKEQRTTGSPHLKKIIRVKQPQFWAFEKEIRIEEPPGFMKEP
jgi:hypothetical protein